MRQVPEWFRFTLAGLPFVSVAVFPWTLTLVFMFGAGLVFPPLPILVGILSDILYYPGAGLLSGTLWGIGLTLASYIVRHIVKTRIM